MKKKNYISLVVILTAVVPSLALAASEPVGFDLPDEFTGTVSQNESLFIAVVSIVNALLAFSALVAAIFVVIGGIRYITSQGDEDATAAAKNTILYAAIGIIVILLSAVLVNFVIGSIGNLARA